MSGNVGIGTTSPNATLDIKGVTAIGNGTQALNADVELTLRGGVEYTGIDFKTARTSGNVGGLRWYGTASDSTPVAQMLVTTDGTLGYLNGTNGAEYRLRIDPNGNVGIGTTSPSAKLDVNGNIYVNNGIYFFRGGTDYSTFIRSNNYPSQGYTGTGDNYWLELNSRGGTHIVLNADGGVGSSENSYDHFTIWQSIIDGDKLMSVSNVGNTYIASNLGIGKTSPSVTLDMSTRTDGINLPKGTTAQRPTPTTGTMRFNTSRTGLEFYDGTNWQVLKADTSVGGASNPASSATEVYNAYNGTASDGVYYYTNGGQTYQAYTKFDWIENEHWVLALKVHNRGDMTSANALWRNTTLSNENDFNLTSGTMSKYGSYVYHPFTRLLMDMNGTYPAVMIWNSQQTSIQAITDANPGGPLSGYACDATNPAIGNSRRYDSAGFYIQGGPFSVQTNREPIVQEYGISCFANSSSNSTTDNTGLSALGYAGAYIGCPLDEGGHTFNVTSNSGADSGFGFGGGAGNAARTWSAGYGEWESTAVVNTLPGYIWIR